MVWKCVKSAEYRQWGGGGGGGGGGRNNHILITNDI